MNERMLFNADCLGKRYNFKKKKEIKKILKKLGSGTYRCSNEFGEDVLLVRKTTFKKIGRVRELSGNGVEVWTFQGNGFLTMEYYNEDGEFVWCEDAVRYDI